MEMSVAIIIRRRNLPLYLVRIINAMLTELIRIRIYVSGLY